MIDVSKLKSGRVGNSSLLAAPIDFLPEAVADPGRFLRDFACIPTASLSPWFRRKAKVMECVDVVDPGDPEQGLEPEYRKNPFDDTNLSFDPEFTPIGGMHYYIHVDLSRTSDPCGIGMSHVEKFVEVSRQDAGSAKVEKVPIVVVDFMGRIDPRLQPNQEISFGAIRNLIVELKQRGFSIRLVTFDGFQSVDSIQILMETHRILAAKLSVDYTMKYAKVNMKKRKVEYLPTNGRYLAVWTALRELMYEDRIHVPYHPYWEFECLGTEHTALRTTGARKKEKVDHGPKTTIDMLQGVGGSVFEAVMNEKQRFVFDYESELRQIPPDRYYSRLPQHNARIGSQGEGADPYYQDPEIGLQRRWEEDLDG